MGTSRDLRHKVAFVVLFLLLCVAVGAGWGALSERAFGAEQAAEEAGTGRPGAAVGTLADEAARCCVVDAHNLARSFRRGRIRHADGFRPGKVFHAPRKARRIIVNKTYRHLRSHPARLRSLPRPAGLPRGCERTERCFAYRLYVEMRSDASCVSRGVPTNRAGTCLRTPQSKLTKKQVQRFGSLVFCGGAVAFGVATSPLSAGATAFIATWGAASCGWAFWMSFG